MYWNSKQTKKKANKRKVMYQAVNQYTGRKDKQGY